jgi:hypothetical protein
MLKLLSLICLLIVSFSIPQKYSWTIAKSECLGVFCCPPTIGSELTIITNTAEKSTIIIPATSEDSFCDTYWSQNSIYLPLELDIIVTSLADFSGAFETNDQIVKIHTSTTNEETSISLLFVVSNLETYQIKAIKSPVFQAVFYTLVECDPNVCCCPDSRLLTITPDPNNSSQVLVNAGFPQNSICNSLGWSNQSQAAWPWPANFMSNNSSPVTFNGPNGLIVTLATVSYSNQSVYVDIKFNQSHAGGSPACFFQMNDAPPAWIGEWLVLQSCDPNSCCCPTLGDNIIFSINASQNSVVLLNASWPNNSICQKLGWNSNNLVSFPLNEFNLYLDNQAYQYSGSNGLTYTVSSSQQYNYTYVALLNINQASVGGSQTCSLKLNNAPASWAGGWVTNLQCGILNCCCPLIGSNMNITPDPQNSSQIIVSGFEVFGLACNNMGWNNQSAFVFPWGNYDLYFNGSMHYRDAQGIKYNWTMGYLDNGTIAGWIQMDQTSVGGPDYCAIPLNNNML